MPLAKHFAGKGDKVMGDMQERYGTKRGREVFYATLQKRKKKRKRKKHKKE